jgi:hypothetical protein
MIVLAEQFLALDTDRAIAKSCAFRAAPHDPNVLWPDVL